MESKGRVTRSSALLRPQLLTSLWISDRMKAAQLKFLYVRAGTVVQWVGYLICIVCGQAYNDSIMLRSPLNTSGVIPEHIFTVNHIS